MTHIKTSQRKGKASLAALTVSTQNSVIIPSSSGMLSTSYDLAKEGRGFAVTDTSYDLAKEGVGFAMVDPAFDIAKEVGS